MQCTYCGRLFTLHNDKDYTVEFCGSCSMYFVCDHFEDRIVGIYHTNSKAYKCKERLEKKYLFIRENMCPNCNSSLMCIHKIQYYTVYKCTNESLYYIVLNASGAVVSRCKSMRIAVALTNRKEMEVWKND